MEAAETLLVLPPDHELVGRRCVVCNDNLQPNDEVVVCPRCKTPHHADCWREVAGCGRHGWPTVAVAVKKEKAEPKGDSHLLKRTPREKAFIALGIVLVLGLVAFAMRPGPDPAAGRTKISIMVPGGIYETDFYEPFIDEFNNSQSELYLAFSVTPSIAYQQKLVVLLGARDAPDIFSLPEEQFLMFAEHRGLLDLAPYLEAEPELVDRFFPNGTDRYRVNDGIYGIPHPGRNEIFTIWALSPNPDTAWDILVMLLEKISTDWPEELTGELIFAP
ncbi:MAG: hypothetical protein GX063_06885, partial [Firmicutes bacterium]|nr:hypothetical protein [Bacillota bacterium]